MAGFNELRKVARRKKVGHKYQKSTTTVWVNFGMSPEFKKDWVEFAQLNKINQSAFFRLCIEKAMREGIEFLEK